MKWKKKVKNFGKAKPNMDLVDVINKRKSTRVFKDKKVPRGILNKAIELANLSPSAGNIQARSLIIIEKPGAIKNIASSYFYDQEWIQKAPMLLIVCANLDESEKKYEDRGKTLYAVQDATIFVSYLQLLLTNFDLASRWVGAFNEKKLSQILDIPKDKRPIIILPVGYPNEEKERKPRKSLKELVLKEI